MFKGFKRKNDDIRRVHPVIWMLCGLIAGIGVGVFVMHARTPEEPRASAVQAIVDSVSPAELQAAVPVNPVTMAVPVEIPSDAVNNPEVIAGLLPVDTCHVVLERTGEVFCSIQAAIDDATQHGDVITVGGGLYQENLMITENRELTLRGEGNPVISPVSAATIHVDNAALVLSGFTVRGTDTGLFISETTTKHITVQDVVFQINPHDNFGYGILVQGGKQVVLNVNDATFQVGGTAVEMDEGQRHTVSFDKVMFQKPNTVLHIQHGVLHRIGFTHDVAFMTSSTIIALEATAHITIEAPNVNLPEEQVTMTDDVTSTIYR